MKLNDPPAKSSSSVKRRDSPGLFLPFFNSPWVGRRARGAREDAALEAYHR